MLILIQVIFMAIATLAVMIAALPIVRESRKQQSTMTYVDHFRASDSYPWFRVLMLASETWLLGVLAALPALYGLVPYYTPILVFMTCVMIAGLVGFIVWRKAMNHAAT